MDPFTQSRWQFRRCVPRLETSLAAVRGCLATHALLAACAQVAICASLAGFVTCLAEWPMAGKDRSRNPVVADEVGPVNWSVPDDKQPGKNIRWSAQLGSVSYGTPVISGGLVWVGTNNDQPRDADQSGDAGVLMCFDERDGRFLYQYVSPRLPGGRRVDWPGSSLASSPLVEGERLWFCTNRCEVVCLDISRLLLRTGAPEVIWKLDMRSELGVVPRAVMIGSHADHCSIAAYRDLIYVNTTNAAGYNGKVDAPQAPSLICLEKQTGRVRWQDNSPGKRILDVQQGSPLVIEVEDHGQVVMGQGDGWLRGFDALTGEVLWMFDINPKSAKTGFVSGDQNNLVVMPVFYENRIYFATGRDFEWGAAQGRLCCIDPARRGDISSELRDADEVRVNPNSGVVWEYFGEGDDKMHRTLSSVAVHQGLVIAPDVQGNIHCLNAQDGRKLWTHDTWTSIFASPLIVGDKVYVADEDGDVTILQLSAQKRVIEEIHHRSSIQASPVFASGTLYVVNRDTLYAIAE
jgi:outer membrane protein assembly factor BamB